MKATKLIYSALALAVVALSSCSNDKFTDTIFPDVDNELDPNSYTYKFDKWIQQSYLLPYNLEFRYKMEDVSADMNYNLVPAELDKAMDLAVLTKHLWFDVYKDIVNEDFCKQYGPRIIHLIGSPAYNPNSGTEILGLAEGGVKVTLFKVNELNDPTPANIEFLNEYYFKTMHHEFSHILHQTKSYPNEFGLISTGLYDANNWQDKPEGYVNSRGFVTPYASSQVREDFAETIANYIVKTDEDYKKIYDYAASGWATDDADALTPVYYRWYYWKNNEVTPEQPENMVYVSDAECVFTYDEEGNRIGVNLRSDKSIIVYPVEDTDGVDGVAVIKQKIEIARNWFKSAWNADLDALRNEVQVRQVSYDINALRKEITDIQ